MTKGKETPLTTFQVLVLSGLFALCRQSGKELPIVTASIRKKFESEEFYVDTNITLNGFEVWIYYDGAGISSKLYDLDERFESPDFESDEKMASELVSFLEERLGKAP